MQREAGHKKRTNELEAENARAYERADKWERIAEENTSKVQTLTQEVKRLNKKRSDDAFELENLQEVRELCTVPSQQIYTTFAPLAVTLHHFLPTLF